MPNRQNNNNNNNNNNINPENQRPLPIASDEDVEFAMEVADDADLEAVERAESADERQGV